MEKVGLSSPWVSFYREVDALFNRDPEVKVVYNEDDNIIKLLVDNQEKAEALEALLPKEREYGNVTVRLEVVPANPLKSSVASLYAAAFRDNPALSFIHTIDGIFNMPVNYVVFDKAVVQYFNDDLSDIYGNKSTLYQEIAKDIFDEREGVFFCTANGEEIPNNDING